MSTVIKASAIPLLLNVLGILGVAYQVGSFKGEIAAKVAALEAADTRHERQIEMLQELQRKTANVNDEAEEEAAVR